MAIDNITGLRPEEDLYHLRTPEAPLHTRHAAQNLLDDDPFGFGREAFRGLHALPKYPIIEAVVAGRAVGFVPLLAKVCQHFLASALPRIGVADHASDLL